MKNIHVNAEAENGSSSAKILIDDIKKINLPNNEIRTTISDLKKNNISLIYLYKQILYILLSFFDLI